MNARLPLVGEPEELRGAEQRFGIPRRQFLQLCAGLTAALGFSRGAAGAVARALVEAPRPSVIWLQFQECTGCTESLLRAEHPTLEKLLLDIISLDYHETLMAAAGHHPAMKLPPEVNLLAVTHYLQALDVQRKADKIVAILGSKTPHIQNVALGGVSNPIALDSQSVLSIERLLAIKEAIDELKQFIQQVYLVDVAAVAAFYSEWTAIGKGVTSYLAAPDFPLDEKGTEFVTSGGYLPGGDLATLQPIIAFGDKRLADNVADLVDPERRAIIEVRAL